MIRIHGPKNAARDGSVSANLAYYNVGSQKLCHADCFNEYSLHNEQTFLWTLCLQTGVILECNLLHPLFLKTLDS